MPAIETMMKSKTLKELRALAKARGLKGYFKLAKDELVRRLGPAEPKPEVARRGATSEHAPKTNQHPPAIAASARAAPTLEEETTRAPTSVAKPAPDTTSPLDRTEAPVAPLDDQIIERAKYASRPNGRSVAHADRDLDEDIDRLPALHEPTVCLLAQKPGILYAYWTLAPETMREGLGYKLRLCRGENESLQIYEEISIDVPRGGWYFHVAEQADDADLLAQLGYYRDGRFVAASGRSIARLPSLHASNRTDERWWIDEADFRRLYLRAGGEVTPTRRYRWSASIGSPGAAPPLPEERMAWPGGVSSQSK